MCGNSVGSQSHSLKGQLLKFSRVSMFLEINEQIVLTPYMSTDVPRNCKMGEWFGQHSGEV
jgi:hypothetical protein